MSATNRGAQRHKSDFYITPPWVLERFLEAPDLGFSGNRWLEPCAGDGAIIRATNGVRSDIVWSACELREAERAGLEPLAPGGLRIGDFREQTFDTLFDLSLSNPPFSIAMDIIQHSRRVAVHTAMLLRLDFWGSAGRAAYLRECPPDTYPLPNRPTFSLNKKGKPGTDSNEYAWFVWPHEAVKRPYGRIRLLAETPANVRKDWSKHVAEQARKDLNKAI